MKKIVIMIAVALSLYSCYDDKGNYEYNDTNEIVIKLKNSYLAESFNTTVEIQPEITQTIRKDNNNLTYTWYLMDNIESEILETLSNEEKLSVVIDRDKEGESFSFSRKMRLAVLDNETGLVHNKDFSVDVTKPYFNCWNILHKKNGVTKLASVEYKNGDTFFDEDAYFAQSGTTLKGEPLKLACFENLRALYYKFDESNNAIRNGFSILTSDRAESGIYCQWDHFKQKDNFGSMIFSAHTADFDMSKISFYGGSSDIVCCVSGGKLFQSLVAGKFYRAPIDSRLTDKELDISKITIDGFCVVMYDKAGKRFVMYRNEGSDKIFDSKVFDVATENKYAVKPLPEHIENAFNPNIIDDEILYIGHGYAKGNWDGSTYAIGYNHSALSIYEFNNYGPMLGKTVWPEKFVRPCCVSKKTIAIPDGFSRESLIETSRGYSNIFFYTTGNTLCRFDFSTNSSTVIYTHPGAVAATNLKFAKRQYTYLENDVAIGDNYTNWQKMGVAYKMADGTFEFVALHIDNTGKVDKKNSDGYKDGEHKYEPIQVYKGLGEVADIEFL